MTQLFTFIMTASGKNRVSAPFGKAQLHRVEMGYDFDEEDECDMLGHGQTKSGLAD